jgi:hypothetical protein
MTTRARKNAILVLSDYIGEVQVDFTNMGDNKIIQYDLDTNTFVFVDIPTAGAESDPVFLASPAGGITATDISNWNTAFGWGNPSGVYEPIISKASGYLTWNGSAWVFKNESYSLSTHDHSGTYEPTITAGTTSQYWRGDKSWQNLTTGVVTEGANLYYTDGRARASISLTTTGTSGAATYSSATGVLNIPQYGGLTDPMTTRGDIIFRNSSNVTTRLARGSSGQFLTSDGTDIFWQTFTGSSNITTVGTISSGTWSAGTIAVNRGGTGQTSYTTGDLLYASSSTVLSKLNAGASGYVLTSNGSGTAPTWQIVPSSSKWTSDTYGISYQSGNVGIGVQSSNLYALFVSKSISSTYVGYFGNTSATGNGLHITTEATTDSYNMIAGLAGSYYQFYVTSAGTMYLREKASAPGTPVDGGFVYVKTDGKIYFKNESGTEFDLTSTGTASAPTLADIATNSTSTAHQTFTVDTSTEVLFKRNSTTKNLIRMVESTPLVEVGDTTASVDTTLNVWGKAYVQREISSGEGILVLAGRASSTGYTINTGGLLYVNTDSKKPVWTDEYGGVRTDHEIVTRIAPQATTSMDFRKGSDNYMYLTSSSACNVFYIPDGGIGTILVRQDNSGNRSLTLAFYSGASGSGSLSKVTIGALTDVNKIGNTYSLVTFKRYGSTVVVSYGHEDSSFQ